MIFNLWPGDREHKSEEKALELPRSVTGATLCFPLSALSDSARKLVGPGPVPIRILRFPCPPAPSFSQDAAEPAGGLPDLSSQQAVSMAADSLCTKPIHIHGEARRKTAVPCDLTFPWGLYKLKSLLPCCSPGKSLRES